MDHTTHNARAHLERAIEDAIAMLDGLDGDADFEPSLGANGAGTAYDAEGDDADLELSGDENEPSIGATDAVNQTRWAGRGEALYDVDLEHDESDFEPWLGGAQSPCHALDAEKDTSDDEFSLGSLDRHVNQEQWAGGESYSGDIELDRSDSEPCLGSPAGGVGNQEHWAQGRDAEENGDEQDFDGDEGDFNGGGSQTEDDPIFSSPGLRMLHVEAGETQRLVTRLADQVARLQDAERLGMLS